MSLLVVERLSVGFRRYDGLVRQALVPVLSHVSLAVSAGEMLAVVGASGAGKSLLAHALFGILPQNAVVAGTARLGDVALDAKGLAQLRGRRMALVPQSVAYLDPLVRCGRQVLWAAQRAGLPDARRAATAAFERFGLDAAVGRQFPHALSGGMARRVLLAIATVAKPELVVADEPTTGLDAETALAVMQHLRAMADAGAAVMAITHDLALAAGQADRVLIMQAGQVAAIEPARAFSGDGAHLQSDYARALWRALPQNDFGAGADHA